MFSSHLWEIVLLIFFLSQQISSIFLSQHLMQVINCREKHSMYRLTTSLSIERSSPSFSVITLCGWLTAGYNTLCAVLTTDGTTLSCRKVGHSWSSFFKTYTLLTSVHNNTDNADDYNRVIGIAQLKAFSCANNARATSNNNNSK